MIRLPVFPRLPRRTHLVLGLVLGCLPMLAPASESARSLALHPAAEVAGDGIFIDQVMAVEPSTPLPRLRIGPAPALGQTASLSRSQITAWLHANAPEFATTNWSGPDRVRVTRKSRMLDETGVRDLLQHHLQTEYVKERGELELRLTRPWTAVSVPEEPLTLKVIESPATGPGANFIVRFELWNGEERVGNWQVAAAAKVWRDVPVALAPLRRGQVVAEAPMALERRDVLAMRDAPGYFQFEDSSLELIENIPAGQPVLARSVRQRPVILRGQEVEALVRQGTLTISLKVEALADALPGQPVRVRNPKTRRELVAKVINEDTVLIPR